MISYRCSVGAPLSPDPESRHHSPGLWCSALHVAGLAQGAEVDSASKWMDIGWYWWMRHCIEALTLQDGFDWNGLDGGSMWKSYIIWMPPLHIMAHPSTESWLPYQRTVDLHRWPQHDDLGLRHDARVALCPWGRREPMPGSFLVWDDDELTKFKWGIMGTNWICDSLSCTL